VVAANTERRIKPVGRSMAAMYLTGATIDEVASTFKTSVAEVKRAVTMICGRQETWRSQSQARSDAPGAFTTWMSMKSRCSAKSGRHYERYVVRGITICERWMKFENFLADMGERPAGTTIDRIDTRLGYLPGNCRWATIKQQARNRVLKNRTYTPGIGYGDRIEAA
jgi:hypothetical protein